MVAKGESEERERGAGIKPTQTHKHKHKHKHRSTQRHKERRKEAGSKGEAMMGESGWLVGKSRVESGVQEGKQRRSSVSCLNVCLLYAALPWCGMVVFRIRKCALCFCLFCFEWETPKGKKDGNRVTEKRGGSE